MTVVKRTMWDDKITPVFTFRLEEEDALPQFLSYLFQQKEELSRTLLFRPEELEKILRVGARLYVYVYNAKEYKLDKVTKEEIVACMVQKELGRLEENGQVLATPSRVLWMSRLL